MVLDITESARNAAVGASTSLELRIDRSLRRDTCREAAWAGPLHRLAVCAVPNSMSEALDARSIPA